MSFKDKMYNWAVKKNGRVCYEYERYVREHMDEHRLHRLRHIRLLIKLNWFYRVKKRNTPYIYWDVPLANNGSKKQSTRKRHLPYLDGAESEANKREDAIIFAKSLLKYDVISFDIFDTLILRPFKTPADLFILVGVELGNSEFYKIRRDAEREAREKKKALIGSTEVTLDDIYTIIEEKTGISKEKGIGTEIKLEKKFCEANPYMKRVFDLLLDNNKTITLVSDMYLPSGVLADILKRCGYEGYDKLFVSCDYYVSKRSKELYYNVLNEYDNKSIVHIGDNWDSDVISARAVGIDARFYKRCGDIGSKYRADGMSEVTGSTYAGIVNNHLHNGIRTYSPYYEYGFIYGGLYVLGFCNWIHRKVKENNIDRVLFLSRDGDIYRKIYNYLFDDSPNEYFLWSRIANTKYTSRKNREDFLRRCLFYRILREEERVSIGSLYETLSLDFLKKYNSDYGLSEEMTLTRGNYKYVEQLFVEHWDEVVKSYDDEKKCLEEYTQNKVGDAKRIAIVDVGWLGSGPKGLKYLIEEEFDIDCKCYCYQAASKPPANVDSLTDLMTKTIEAYLFSRMENRNHYDQHASTNKGTNNIYFELFTQSKSPSYSGISSKGEFLFDIPEVENYNIVNEIHRGIFDFAKEYNERFKDDEFLLNIAGYDSYCAFRMIIRNLKFIKKHFSSLSYARGIGGDNSKLEFATLGDIIESSGA